MLSPCLLPVSKRGTRGRSWGRNISSTIKLRNPEPPILFDAQGTLEFDSLFQAEAKKALSILNGALINKARLGMHPPLPV